MLYFFDALEFSVETEGEKEHVMHFFNAISESNDLDDEYFDALAPSLIDVDSNFPYFRFDDMAPDIYHVHVSGSNDLSDDVHHVSPSAFMTLLDSVGLLPRHLPTRRRRNSRN